MSEILAQSNAKANLSKIDDLLIEPHIIIGGLATQQYVVARNSSDIDIICDSQTATSIIDKLYPLDEYVIKDENDDEYRPAFVITPRTGGQNIVLIGPKILERQPYQYLTWSVLENNAQKFRVNNIELKNILVPSSEALSYTKLLSFLTRFETNKEKGEQDLRDFVNLTNHVDFNLNRFVDLIRNSGSIEYIQNKIFELKKKNDLSLLQKSPLLFGQNTIFSGKRSTPKTKQKIEYEEVFATEVSPSFYDRISQLYDIRNSNFLYTAHQKTVEKLREIFAHKENSRLLDIGSGTGRLIATHFLHRTNIHWTAVDASIGMNKLFSENLEVGKMPFDVVCCDVTSDIANIPDIENIDVFLLSFSLTSLPNLEPLKNLVERAKNGADFVIADIHAQYTKDHPYYDFVETDGTRIALKPNQIYSDKVNEVFKKFGGVTKSHFIIKRPPDDTEYAFLTHYKMSE